MFTPFAFVKTLTVGTDPDAQAFIDATGISGSNATAITTLVTDLKGYGVWGKLQAAYPFIGGTATTNKYNLINPADTDAAFRLTFSGGVTHDSNGVTFDGINGYANTFYTPSTNGSLNSQHISVYNRTAGLTSGFFIAVRDNASAPQCFLGIQFDPTRVNYISINSTEVNEGTYSSLQGFLLGNRSGASAEQFYRNGAEVDNSTKSSNRLPAYSLYLGARNFNGSPQSATYTAYNVAFATIGTTLTSTEEGDLYTSIQTYQTSLGRNI